MLHTHTYTHTHTHTHTHQVIVLLWIQAFIWPTVSANYVTYHYRYPFAISDWIRGGQDMAGSVSYYLTVAGPSGEEERKEELLHGKAVEILW